MLNRDYFKKQLLKALEAKLDIVEAVTGLTEYGSVKTELLWSVDDLLKENKISVADAVKIARSFQFDPDPELHDQLDQDVRKNEDTRVITTVRGTLAWFLQTIVSKLEVAYFKDVLDILEGAKQDTEEQQKLRLATGDNLYVRQQATIPLEILIANARAVQNPDGTPFSVGEDNRKRIERLAFRMLDENKEYPRVLEYLSSVFSRIRYLGEKEAEYVLETFFYSSSGTLNPDYVLENICALAIYYAEFRKDAIKDSFNEEWFQSFLKKLIREDSIRLKGTIIWLIWKTCKEDIGLYKKFEKYVPLFYEQPLDNHLIHQIEFLCDVIADNYPEAAIELFNKELQYIDQNVGEADATGKFWMSFSTKILEKIAKDSPDNFAPTITKLYQLWQQGVYVGEWKDILNSYKSVEEEKKHNVRNALNNVVDQLKNQVDLTTLEW